MAFALSQIFVVSGAELRSTYGLAGYQQLLLEDAFDNIRTLLEDITLSPAMGAYLNLANNDKPDPVRATHANENYARELLQLFSIGLVKLNPDGTPILDANGQPMATYDESIIQGLARAFTGWTYPTAPGAQQRPHNPVFYQGELEPIAANHDQGEKLILDGHTLPAGQSAEQDLAGALDAVFNHPNLGPFLCRQLIQHLVTSNPSPAYVARISAVFADNGQKIRGDLSAVIPAILLDPEARGDANTDPSFGKVREPALFVAGLARTLGVTSDGVFLRNQSTALEQPPYESPSVFNFYPPNYALAGKDLVSPPSALLDSASALGRANFVNRLVTAVSSPIDPDPTVDGSTGTQVSLAGLAQSADDGAMLDALDRLLLHHTMAAQMKQAILPAMSAIPADPTARAGVAVYLVATSPQYQVER